MQNPALRCGVKLVSTPVPSILQLLSRVFTRRISLNSAINKGIRRSQKGRSRFDDAARSPNKRAAGDSNGRFRDRPFDRNGGKGLQDRHSANSSGLNSGRARALPEYQTRSRRTTEGSYDRKLSDRRERRSSVDQRESPSSSFTSLRSREAERRPDYRRNGPPRPSANDSRLEFGELRASTNERNSVSSSSRTTKRPDRDVEDRPSGRRFEKPARDISESKRPEGQLEPIGKRPAGHGKARDTRGSDRQSMGAGSEVISMEPRQRRRESYLLRDGDHTHSQRSPTEADSWSSSKDPVSIPYTTSASEFIYGASSVVAAMRARRRRFYKLYIHKAVNREDTVRDDSIENLAKSRSIPVRWLKDPGALPLLDKMSNSRPHNGFVLEASPCPRLPIAGLPPFVAEEDGFRVSAAPQSKEDSNINGTDILVPFDRHQKPHPLVILLDGIQDPGNFGGIIRTAYYLGVSAVAFVPRTTSSVTPVVVKASAGAAEFLPLLRVSNSSIDFISESRQAGWKVYAAVAPDSVKEQSANPRRKGQRRQPTMDLPKLSSLLDKSPCVLVLGGEGFGISPKILELVDGKVVIKGVKRPKLDGLDSLNVSVAAGLLCSGFFRNAEGERDGTGKGFMDQEDGGESEHPKNPEQSVHVLGQDVDEGEDLDEDTEGEDEEGRKGQEDWARVF